MGAPSPGSAYQGLVLPPAGERAQSGAPHPLIRAAWERICPLWGAEGEGENSLVLVKDMMLGKVNCWRSRCLSQVRGIAESRY